VLLRAAAQRVGLGRRRVSDARVVRALDTMVSTAVGVCPSVPPRNALASAVGVSSPDIRAVSSSDARVIVIHSL